MVAVYLINKECGPDLRQIAEGVIMRGGVTGDVRTREGVNNGCALAGEALV